MGGVTPPGSPGHIPTTPPSPRGRGASPDPVTKVASTVLHGGEEGAADPTGLTHSSLGRTSSSDGSVRDAGWEDILAGLKPVEVRDESNAAATELAKNPQVSSAIKNALQTAHNALKILWNHLCAPLLAGVTVGGAVSFKISFLAFNVVFQPFVYLAKLIILAIGKACNKEFKQTHENIDKILGIGLLSGLEFHPTILKGDFSMFQEIFTGIDPKEAFKHLITAREAFLASLVEAPPTDNPTVFSHVAAAEGSNPMVPVAKFLEETGSGDGKKFV